MNKTDPPAKVASNELLGHASEAQPLVARLRARLAGSICNADGTYTIGNCPPDALSQEAADEIERLQEREAFILNVTRDAQQIAGACGAEIERMRAALAAIDKHSACTLRTNSKDRGDWAEDVAFMGKLARGH